MYYMKINFNPEQCLGCFVCMSVKEECRLLISMIRVGGPRFGEKNVMQVIVLSV